MPHITNRQLITCSLILVLVLTHTSITRTIDRDPARHLVTLTLDDGTRARLTYRQAAQLGFWFTIKYGESL